MQDVLEELRRYLRQRLEVGERVSILPLRQRPGAVPESRATSPPIGTPMDAAPAAEPLSGGPVPPREAAGALVAGDSLERVAAEIRACTRCRLHETRTQAVPGVGPQRTRLVFVGEGPGAEEDAQGEPFVGRAGQLLNRILAAVNLRRQDVYITNIVKCRPPANRDPQPDEIAACRPFLERQLRLLEPRVLCALGRHAASALLGKQESLSALRAGSHSYQGIPVFPTYHPAALLRNPQWKRPVWEDIQKVRREYDAAGEKP